MSEDAARFRRRARECLDLAERARAKEDRDSLYRMARELDEEADKIEAEESRDGRASE